MEMKTPQYNTMLFHEIYGDYDTFGVDYDQWCDECGLQNNKPITNNSLKLLFMLLMSKYKNSPIANSDVNQFKLKVFSIIFQYGPTWEKRLDIQKTLRELSDADITAGSVSIFNHAFNPSSEPGTLSTDELSYINDQNTSKNKKSKLEGYTLLWQALKVDVTSDFIDRFKVLFKQIVRHENPLLYISEVYEYDEPEVIE